MSRICLVNALFPPETHGGAENYVLRTAKALQKRGHEIAVLTSGPYDGTDSLHPQRMTYEGIPVWRFFPPNLSHRSDGTGGTILEKGLWHAVDALNPQAARAVGQVLDRTEPDVVHTNNLMGISTVAARLLQRRDVRHVHTLHDYSLVCPKSNLLRDLTAPDDDLVVCKDPPTPCRLFAGAKKRLVGTPDLVTAPSQHVIDVHRKHGFFEDVDCTQVELGADTVADQPPTVPDRPSALYVGKQLRSKGLDILFEVAQTLPNVEFHVCGTGPYAETTERRAAAIDNLSCHGYVSEEVLAERRRNASLGVVPSIWMENSPLTIYESFGVGLPVVGSDIGGIPELIDPGRTGLLFDPGNATAFAERISALVSAPERLGRMRAAALQWAGEYTLDRHVDRLCEKVYVLAE